MNVFRSACGVMILLFLCSGLSSNSWGQVLRSLSGTQGVESINEGVGQYHQRNWNAAISQFKKALQKNPNSAVAHYNMGLTLSQMGQQDKADEHFRKASQFGSSNQFIRNSPQVKRSLERQMR